MTPPPPLISPFLLQYCNASFPFDPADQSPLFAGAASTSSDAPDTSSALDADGLPFVPLAPTPAGPLPRPPAVTPRDYALLFLAPGFDHQLCNEWQIDGVFLGLLSGGASAPLPTDQAALAGLALSGASNRSLLSTPEYQSAACGALACFQAFCDAQGISAWLRDPSGFCSAYWRSWGKAAAVLVASSFVAYGVNEAVQRAAGPLAAFERHWTAPAAARSADHKARLA